MTDHRFGDNEYCIRDDGWCYSVAKFDGGKRPAAVYTVISDGCSCPARVIGCKHVRIVERWKGLGKPWMVWFNDKGEVL